MSKKIIELIKSHYIKDMLILKEDDIDEKIRKCEKILMIINILENYNNNLDDIQIINTFDELMILIDKIENKI